MSKLLSRLCCCLNSGEEDEQYLVLNHDQDEPDGCFPQQTQSNSADHPIGSNGHTIGGNRLSFPDLAAEPFKTREQQEEDLLNKILHHAQESIIDVSHINENGADNIDVAQRSRAYGEAIHKLESAKRKANRTEDDSNLLGYLITDSSADTSSSRPQHIQPDEIELILKTSQIFGEAVKSGLGIQPTESLVAYMSLD